jgi:hypothetical protein
MLMTSAKVFKKPVAQCLLASSHIIRERDVNEAPLYPVVFELWCSLNLA